MRLQVFSVFHKSYWIPEDRLYEPIQVGFQDSIVNTYTQETILRDNTGDNISSKNNTYCELTALYWIWRNIDFSKYDYIGLDHYRRHFAASRSGDKHRRVITEEQLTKEITSCNKPDIILPKKRHYWIETNYSQYIHAHHEEDLIITRKALEALAPSYLTSYDSMMKKTSGHKFNMFIMKSEVLNKYCTWLFPILGYIEANLDISSYSEYDSRVFGFIAERLLDVWLSKNNPSYIEMIYVFEDKENWCLKIFRFLKRRFIHTK